MSRRKQTKPRHLGPEGDLEMLSMATAAVEAEDEPIAAAAPLQPESTVAMTTKQSTALGDAHCCGKCQAEFYEIAEFLQHKKTCTNNKRELEDDFAEDEKKIEPPTKAPRVEDDVTNNNEVKVGKPSVSTRLWGEGGGDGPVLPLSQLCGPKHFADDGSSPMEEVDCDEGKDDSSAPSSTSPVDDVTTFGSNPEMLAQIQNMQHLAAMQHMLHDSNVKLEALQNTKVAVAQIAEDEEEDDEAADEDKEGDGDRMSSLLYTLQQQQMLQMQWLQHLQNQIATNINGFPPNFPPPAGLAPPMPAAPPAVDGKNNDLEAMEKLSSMGQTTPPGAAMPPKVTPPNGAAAATERNQEPVTPGGFQPSGPHGSPSADLMLKGKSGCGGGGSSGGGAGAGGGAGGAGGGDSGKPTYQERSSYAADDPYFKHKCRFCHKVFGSDSALQIHIRSHTGERPFKCNICGNRFSTRGNLKVHFQRHKEQYPHVEMNPNPVPEHLDEEEKRPDAMLMAPVPLGRTEAIIPPPVAVPASVPIPPLIKVQQEPLAPSRVPPPPPPAAAFKKEEDDRRRSPSPRTMDGDGHRGSDVMSEQELNSDGDDADSNSGGPRDFNLLQGKAADLGRLPFPSSIPMLPGGPLPTGMGSPPGPGFPGFPGFPGLEMSPFPFAPQPRPSILPPKMEDPMEQYMEVDKSSETSKLESMVKNLESKLTDPNQCAICQRVLSCKSALQMHYRTHTGERPFRCKICGRAFTTKGNLKTHMGVHRAKPPVRMLHQCPVCHNQFTNALVLQQHIRTHTGDLPKDAPGLGSPEMMAAAGFLPPFPGPFPFMPPGLAPPPLSAIGAAGEMDLSRKLPFGEHLGLQDPNQHFKSEDSNDNGQDNLSDLSDSGDDVNERQHSADGDDESKVNYEKTEVNAMVTDEERGSDRPHDGANSDDSEERDAMTSSLRDQRPSVKQESPKMDHLTPPTYTPLFESSVITTSSLPPASTSSSYPASLMALQDRVDAIDRTAGSAFGPRPLDAMANMFHRTEMSLFQSPQKSGDVSPPRSPRVGHSHRSPSPSRVEAAHSPAQRPLPPGVSGFPFSGLGSMDLSPGGYNQMGRHTSCNICYKTFACRSALEIHYRSHTKERPFKCEVCERSFSTKGNMKQHMLTHKIRDLPNQVASPAAPASSEESKINSAPLQAPPPAPVSAPMTSSSSGVAPHLDSPFKIESKSSPPAATQAAPEKQEKKSPSLVSMAPTPPKMELDNHPLSQGVAGDLVRRSGSKHMCMVCMKPFSSASALQIHMRTHTGDKPFKCQVCGKAFTTKGNLKVHMGTHMWNNVPSRRGRRMSVDFLAPGMAPPPPGASLPPPPPPHSVAHAPLHASVPNAPPHAPPALKGDHENIFSHAPPPMPPLRPPLDLHPGFPFSFPGFPAAAAAAAAAAMNGFGPAHAQRMNEISVIQSSSGVPMPMTSAARSPRDLEKGGAAFRAGSPDRSPVGKPRSHGDEEEGLDLSVRKGPHQNSATSSPPSDDSECARSTSPDQDQPTMAAHGATWLFKTTCQICSKVCHSAPALDLHIRSAHMNSMGKEEMKPLMT